MKEGWRMVKLGEVADLQSGYTPSKDDLRTSGNYPYFKVGEMNLIENSVYLQKTSQYINNPRKIYKRGSVVFPRNGGAVYTEKKRILLKDSVIDLNTGAIIPNEKIVYNRYLYMWTCYEKFSKYDNGGGLPSLNFKKMINTEISLPSLEEQHRIVSLLDASFEKIDALKKNAEENLKNAKALFQQVLAQELKPKDDWVEKKLQDVCEIINGYAFPSSAFKKNNEVKVIKITNVGVGKFIKDDENKLPQHYLTDVEDVIINELDIVVALTRTIIAEGLKVAIVPKEYDGALLNQRVAALRMYPKVLLREYLYYYFQTKYAKEYVLSRVNTLMQPNLSIKDLRDMPIPYLPFETQHRIVRTLDTLSEKCRRLEQVAQQTIRECDALKQSILRQAFSGEL